MKVSALLFLFCSLAVAEDNSLTDGYDAGPTRLGLEAGMVFSNVAAPRDVTSSNRTGLAVGLNLEVPITSAFSLFPEALFVQRGSDLARAGVGSARVSYNALEFPMLGKVKIGQVIAPYLVAGPVAIFNLSSTVEGDGVDASWAYRPNTFDLGLGLGAGVDVGPVFASLRYTAGLLDLDTNSSEWRSRGVHLLGGVRL